MDNYRLFLLLTLGFIVVLLWQAWEEQNRGISPIVSTATNTNARNDNASVPNAFGVVPSAPQAPTVSPSNSTTTTADERILVATDLIRAEISTEGGDLRDLQLLAHPISVDQPNEPVLLLRNSKEEVFIAQSGLIGHGGDFPTHEVRYRAEQTRYELKSDVNELRVPLHYQGKDGARYTKFYVFRRGTYVIDVEYVVENRTTKEWSGFLYAQLEHSAVEQPHFFSLPIYTGGAFYTPVDGYQKVTFADMSKKPLADKQISGGWVAMLKHYFTAAWIIEPNERALLYTRAYPNDRFAIGFNDADPTRVAPGETGRLHVRLYAGPKEQERLADVAPGLEHTVDYGLLAIISKPLFQALSWINGWIGNWGWSIIILTILVKLAFYPLSAASYKSMAQMKKLQPKLQSLKERYGDDRQKMNQAMMELYKTEKINPLGGCLPILIQIPVFIALYWVLLESVELRQAPFVLWIKDLSQQDPYYVLPIIMGVTMYAQQLLNPQPPDPIQRRIFMIMPIAFTAMFLFFPAGLVLYWVVNNVLSILQQWRINQVIVAKGG